MVFGVNLDFHVGYDYHVVVGGDYSAGFEIDVDVGVDDDLRFGVECSFGLATDAVAFDVNGGFECESNLGFDFGLFKC